jgi:hypothetical protein
MPVPRIERIDSRFVDQHEHTGADGGRPCRSGQTKRSGRDPSAATGSRRAARAAEAEADYPSEDEAATAPSRERDSLCLVKTSSADLDERYTARHSDVSRSVRRDDDRGTLDPRNWLVRGRRLLGPPVDVAQALRLFLRKIDKETAWHFAQDSQSLHS